MPILYFLTSIGTAAFAFYARIAALWPVFLLWFAQRLTARTAMLLFYTAGTVALFVSFGSFLDYVTSAISSPYVPSGITGVLEMFLPSNTITCISAIFSVKGIHLVYLWWRHLLSRYAETYIGG